MNLIELKKNFKETHLIYIFYSIPILFLIGRASVDFFFTYLGLNFLLFRIIIERDLAIIKNKIFLFGLLFCFLLIFVSIFSTNLQVSLFKSLTYLRFVLFFGASVYILKSKYFDKKIFFYFLILGLSILNLDIMIQYIFKYDIFGYEPVKNSVNSYRYSGLYGDEFIAGGYIQKFLLIFILFNVSNPKIFYKKYFFEIIVTLSIVIILITGDRMPLINIVYSIIFLFVFFKSIRMYLLNLSIFLLVVSLTISFLDKGISDRIVSIKTQLTYKVGDQYYNPHLNLVRQSLKIYQNNKLFGTGIKTFRVTCSLDDNKVIFINKKYNSNFCSNHPHNYYLEILSETGIIGLIGFIVFVLCFLHNSFFSKDYLLNNKIAFISLCIFIFPIASTGSFFTNMNACYFWFFVSLINIKILSKV